MFFFLVSRIFSKPVLCSRDFLLGLSKFSSPPPGIVRRRVFFFNLKSCSFSSVLNSISSSTTSSFSSSTSPHPSLISSSHLKSESSFLSSNLSNSTHNFSKLFKSINISFLNIRSLNNKFIHVFNLLSDSNLHFLALSETWHESASSPSLISACPPFYSFLKLARAPFFPLMEKCVVFTKLFFPSPKLLILILNFLNPLSLLLNLVLSPCLLLLFIDLLRFLSLPLLMTSQPYLNFYILFPLLFIL